MLIQEGIENWTAPERSKSSNHGARRLFFAENDCFIQKRIRNVPTRLFLSAHIECQRNWIMHNDSSSRSF